MTLKPHTADRIFVGLVAALVIIGLFAFGTAGMAVLAEDRSVFFRMLVNQLVLGLGGGMAALYLTQRLDYLAWKKYAWILLGLGLLATALVFVPGLGFEHGGAKRWLNLGPFSFQPSELLKLVYVIYLAAWFAWIKERITEWRWGMLPFLGVTALAAVLLLLQPDTDTLMVMIAAGGVMYLVAGAPWKHIAIILAIGIVGFAGLVAVRPYLMERVTTFLNPAHDPLGSSYQIQQALIAFGSGGIGGRGFGQGIQKFRYLPEPAGDSIFAVMGEEWGLIGTLLVVGVYTVFMLRGYRIGTRARDQFGQLLVIGIITFIMAQVFLNMASILGLFPLSGIPLVFMSQGGTSLLFGLAAVGIVINVSKSMKIK